MKTIELHTNHGVIRAELDDAKAPKTLRLNAGHYDGTVFHRVIRLHGPGRWLRAGHEAEALRRTDRQHGLKNDKYTLAMARTNAPHSAVQFFINATDNAFLNFKSESPQGWATRRSRKVSAGTERAAADTGRRGGHDDVPLEDVVIQRAIEVT